MFWATVCFLLVTSLLSASNASIHSYGNQGFTVRLNARVFHGGTEALYASSFIRFDEVTFVRTVESASKQNAMKSTTGIVEAIVFEVKHRDKIAEAVCCTPELADAGSCSPGELVITRSPEDPKWPIKMTTFFKGSETEAKFPPEGVLINKTGVYYLYFMICDPELDGTVIRGRTVWKNPHGYLPGKLAPLIKFFGFMSLAYFVLGLVWFIRVVRYWNTIVQLEYAIMLIIALGMLEMAFKYFAYTAFNSTGTNQFALVLWGVTFSSAKKTLSRLLLLLVSKGYGIMEVNITAKMLLLGLGYFVATETLEFVDNVGNMDDFPRKTVLVLVIQLGVLDACFILWIFSSLARTLEKLQISGNIAKLEQYRNLTNALAISALISIVFFGFELYFNTTDPLSKLWRMAWIIPAFWHCLSYGLLAFICFFWAS